MTASHSLFHVIPDNERKTRRGCASASVNFRDTCPSPRYFSSPAPRLVSLLCFHPPSPPPPPKQRTQEPLNGRSRGLYYTEEEGGGRRGRTAREVRDWHPNLDSSLVAHSVNSYLGMKFSRLERNQLGLFPRFADAISHFIFLQAPGHPELQCWH